MKNTKNEMSRVFGDNARYMEAMSAEEISRTFGDDARNIKRAFRVKLPNKFPHRGRFHWTGGRTIPCFPIQGKARKFRLYE